MTRAGAQHGFTLVETLVAAAISIAILGASLTVLELFQRDVKANLQRSETQDAARTALDRIEHELRGVASPSVTTAGALEVTEPYSIIFETLDPTATTAENPTGRSRVRYCLADTKPTEEVLWRQVKHWTKTEPAVPTSTACPDSHAGDWDTSTRLVEHVVNEIGGQNRTLFTYGPTGATTAAQVTTVATNVYIDLKPGSRPGESQLTTSVSFRNDNRTPVASFTAVELGSGRRVLLNASESYDPDGLALSYKWWDNGTELQTTAQQYETESETLGSVHTFKLQVTNPGGLIATSEQTVTIK